MPEPGRRKGSCLLLLHLPSFHFLAACARLVSVVSQMFCDDLIRHKVDRDGSTDGTERDGSKKLTMEDLECAEVKLDAMKMEMMKVRCY